MTSAIRRASAPSTSWPELVGSRTSTDAGDRHEPNTTRNGRAVSTTNVLFLLATVLTTAGLWLTPERVGERGLPAARAATVAYLVGATAWLTSLVFRLSVTPGAASAFVAEGSLDPTYVITNQWAVGMFGVFTWLAGGSLVALGLAVLLGRALPAPSGWFAIAVGIVVAGGYAITGEGGPRAAQADLGLRGAVHAAPAVARSRRPRARRDWRSACCSRGR